MTYNALWQRLTALYDAGEAKAIARMVLDVRFGLSLTDILCGKDTQLSTNDQTELEKIALRLCEGEPVQYVLGVADFCGRQFRVVPGVLIPRPETAGLCQWVLEGRGRRSEERGRRSEEGGCSVLDIGTGSGCIAVTLAAEMPEARVTAWDISEEALRIATDNARRLHAGVTFERRDALGSSIPLRPWDIIVSNPPYIQPEEHGTMERNVLDYEPHTALFAPEKAPTIFYQRIGDYAARTLTPGGRLFFELNPLTASSVCEYLRRIGFSRIEVRHDQYGKQRFLKATKI